MSDGGAIEVELDRTSVDPGDLVTGRLRIRRDLEVRRVSVVPVLVERTGIRAARAGSGHDLRAGDEVDVAGPGELAAGTDVAFAARLPADAEHSYRTSTASRTWQIRCRVSMPGPDLTAGADVDMSDRNATSATPARAAVAERASRRLHTVGRRNAWLGLGLVAMGVLLLVIGLGRQGDEGGGAAVLLSTGGAAAVAGLVLAASSMPWPLRGVDLEVADPVAHPGGRVDVAIDNRTNRTVAVALRTVVCSQRTGGSATGTGYTYNPTADVVDAEWHEVAPGRHHLGLMVPADAVPTAGGRLTSLVHQVVVTNEPTDAALPRRRRSALVRIDARPT